jgi:hypothetical protein
LQADAVFWQTLHAGRYEDIGRALELKTAAYLENPGDALTAAHAGWLHIWRLAESGRLAQVPATITNDAVMARKYFEEAVRLQPSEARFQGFLGSALLAEGSIHRDEKLTRRGYYTLPPGPSSTSSRPDTRCRGCLPIQRASRRPWRCSGERWIFALARLSTAWIPTSAGTWPWRRPAAPSALAGTRGLPRTTLKDSS